MAGYAWHCNSNKEIDDTVQFNLTERIEGNQKTPDEIWEIDWIKKYWKSNLTNSNTYYANKNLAPKNFLYLLTTTTQFPKSSDVNVIQNLEYYNISINKLIEQWAAF